MPKTKPNLGHSIRGIGHMINRLFLANAKALGLDETTTMHAWILRYLKDHENQVVFQKTLEQEFRMHKSSMSRILTLMESKGLIRRESMTDDHRKNQLFLTEKGNELESAIKAAVEKTENQILEGISKDELKVCKATFNKIIENCKKGVDHHDQNIAGIA